jgi:hypothetical protein
MYMEKNEFDGELFSLITEELIFSFLIFQSSFVIELDMDVNEHERLSNITLGYKLATLL